MSYYPRSTASSDIGTHASDRMWLYRVLTAQYAADAILKHCNFLLWEWHCAGYKHKINVPSWSAIQGLQWYSKDEQHCWERSVRGVNQSPRLVRPKSNIFSICTFHRPHFREQFTTKYPVIVHSSPCQWKVRWGFVVRKTFLTLHSTGLQHSHLIWHSPSLRKHQDPKWMDRRDVIFHPWCAVKQPL